MNRKQLNEILNELKAELGIKDAVKIELKPMKTKAASVSLTKSIIRINKNIIPNLDTECLKYLILHELIHYKLKSTYHNGRFHKELNRKISKTEAKQLERKILKTLLQINPSYKNLCWVGDEKG